MNGAPVEPQMIDSEKISRHLCINQIECIYFHIYVNGGCQDLVIFAHFTDCVVFFVSAEKYNYGNFCQRVERVPAKLSLVHW